MKNNSSVKIKKYPHLGRGLEATQDIQKGETVEVSELIILNRKDSAKAEDEKMLSLLMFMFSYGEDRLALALGIGSLFNHSTRPNVDYEIRGKKIHFTALKKIKKGQQLFINYGYDPLKFYT